MFFCTACVFDCISEGAGDITDGIIAITYQPSVAKIDGIARVYCFNAFRKQCFQGILCLWTGHIGQYDVAANVRISFQKISQNVGCHAIKGAVGSHEEAVYIPVLDQIHQRSFKGRA